MEPLHSRHPWDSFKCPDQRRCHHFKGSFMYIYLELEGLQLAAKGKRSIRGTDNSRPCQSSNVYVYHVQGSMPRGDLPLVSESR